MSQKGSFLQSLISFAFALAVLLSFRWALFEPYVIPSGSMMPSLLINDHILVNKSAFGLRMPFSKTWLTTFQPPSRGDIVVFRSINDDGYFMIKRVVALAGDTVEYTNDGRLIVNQAEVERVALELEPSSHEGFYEYTEADVGGDFDRIVPYKESLDKNPYRTQLDRYGYRYAQPEMKVPEGHVFVMGDNRDNSRDSRYWGALPVENLLGKAMFVWLSCEETLKQASFICNPAKIRWSRFFHAIR